VCVCVCVCVCAVATYCYGNVMPKLIYILANQSL